MIIFVTNAIENKYLAVEESVFISAAEKPQDTESTAWVLFLHLEMSI